MMPIGYLEYNFLRGLVSFQKMANINKCPLLTGTIFTFKMIPAKLNKLLSMMNKVTLKIF